MLARIQLATLKVVFLLGRVLINNIYHRAIFCLELLKDDDETANRFLAYIGAAINKKFIVVSYSEILGLKKYKHFCFLGNDGGRSCSFQNDEEPNEIDIPDFVINYRQTMQGKLP